jgi:hypothetical protein
MGEQGAEVLSPAQLRAWATDEIHSANQRVAYAERRFGR